MTDSDHRHRSDPPASRPGDRSRAGRGALRKQFRVRRQALDGRQQGDAAQAVAAHLRDLALAARFRRWAVYAADDGEVDLSPWIVELERAGRTVLFPIIDGQSLLFASMDRERKNRFGISEPDASAAQVVAVADVDVVILPLVAFDARGTRLGRGGGFYDRALGAAVPRPLLIGVAHDCQRSPQPLPTADHDVPLDAVVTPAAVERFSDRLVRAQED